MACRKKTEYCQRCGREVGYFLRRTRRYGTYDGIRCRYKGVKARCEECGMVLEVPFIAAYNAEKLARAAEKQKNKEIEQHDDSWRITRHCIWPAGE